MPKMICTPCQVELRISKSGVAVIEHAHFGPCKVWSADEWACPNCGATIVAGFGNHPIHEHYEPDFQDGLDHIAKHPEIIRLDFENQGQRAQWLTQQASLPAPSAPASEPLSSGSSAVQGANVQYGASHPHTSRERER